MAHEFFFFFKNKMAHELNVTLGINDIFWPYNNNNNNNNNPFGHCEHAKDEMNGRQEKTNRNHKSYIISIRNSKVKNENKTFRWRKGLWQNQVLVLHV